MRKLSCGRALSRLCLSSAAAVGPENSSFSCLCCFRSKSSCISSVEEEEKPLIRNNYEIRSSNSMKLKDVIAAQPPTLAYQLKPKMVVMKVAMHCHGCARKVQKHISKLEGVTSYEVDLETKMVVVTGDIVPFEVLESVSKVKNAQLWDDNSDV